MLILLKFICFGLWFAMVILLGLASPDQSQRAGLFSLQLTDPARAERQIYEMLRKLRPDMQLSLTISRFHPARSELEFIADCMGRKYPAILIQFSGAEGR